jgi:hypothetical protein
MKVFGRHDGLHQAISLGTTEQKRVLDFRQPAATTQVL